MQREERFTCPCCGELTLDEPPSGRWRICDICGWEDDFVQFEDLAYEDGASPRCRAVFRLGRSRDRFYIKKRSH